MVELIWDGKYTPDGKKSAPVRLTLPFQDVETVNESAQQRQRQLDFFSSNRPSEWRNRLIWGDKKYVLPSLLDEFAGKINLIYIDPPFATGADFSHTATLPDDPFTEGDQSTSFTKQPSMIEQKAYRDTWGRGLDGYLQWFYETVTMLYELLSENGSIYVHCDSRVNSSLRVILDEIFGSEHFVNEISWKRSANTSSIGKIWKRAHDTLLFYTKSQNYTFNFQRKSLSETSLDIYSLVDAKGRHRLVPLLVSGKRNGQTGQPWRGIDPNSRGRNGMHWVTTVAKLEAYDEQGLIVWPAKEGGVPNLKYYLEDNPGVVVSDVWDDINLISSGGTEALNYPTQKPEALLERLLNASSNEGDLILDCFCGSGTTAAVAEKLNRRWITCDLGRFAIHTARKRLLSIPNVRPFVVQNLGKYERQAWQSAEFGDNKERAAQAQTRYRRFIMDLYGAEPLDGYAWLHGTRAGHFVHIGSVDAPITDGDIRAIAREFWKAAGKDSGATTNTVEVLGWDFAFELNEMGKQLAVDANIRLIYRKIPREVLEKKAVEQGDIRFFELAALSVQVDNGKSLTVTTRLCDFIIPPDDVPEEVQLAITHWSQFIDYWAVDWDYKGDTFHNQWQSYRTKKQGKLELDVEHTYDAPGSYTVVVKVIDILGNDTTKSIQVEVR